MTLEKIVKKLAFFVSAGLFFALLGRASINFDLFFDKIISFAFFEIFFLLFFFFINQALFLRIKRELFSYLSSFFFGGVFLVFFLDYLIKDNTGFRAILFLFLFRAIQVSIARISSEIDKQTSARSSFLRALLVFYILYVSVGFLAVFGVAKENIWNFSFLVFYIAVILLYFKFLLNVIYKKEDRVKETFKDVIFY